MIVDAPPREPPPQDPEALIEEARRRQRRRRRRVAAAAAVLALGAGLGYWTGHGGRGGAHALAGDNGPQTSQARRQRQLVRAAARRTIGAAALLAPGVGWAMNGAALWLTTDDGAHWTVVTPSTLLGQDVIGRVADVDFADARHGWVSAELDGARSVDGGFRYGGISLTADGGRTWRTTTLPGCYACANTHLSFLDDRSGFALTLGEDAHAKIVRRLYRTTDGGRRWELVRNMPFSGRIEFTGPKTGWALTDPARWLQTGCCAIPVEEGIVYRTLDGGYTWHRVALPTPARAMRFFGPRDGVVAVLPEGRRRHRRRVGVYTTSDGGSTWTAHSAPAAADQPDSRQGIPDFPFSAASVSDWALFAHGTLFRTRDGGRTWTTVDPTPRPQPSVWSVDFATPSRGWAIFAAGEAGAALVRTTDGGRTWTPLAPPR